MTGVANSPPMLPMDVKGAAAQVLRRGLAGAGLGAEPLDVAGDLAEVLAVGVAHHRDEQAVRGRHRDAEVVAVVEDDLAGGLVERGVDQRHLLERRRHRLDGEGQVGHLGADLGRRVAQTLA